MLVTEIYALCTQCGLRQPVKRRVHPPAWSRVVVGQLAHYFCCKICLSNYFNNTPTSSPPILQMYGLVHKDIQIINMIAAGYQNKTIARQLGLAYATVKNRITNMKRRLGTATRVDLVTESIRLGLIKV